MLDDSKFVNFEAEISGKLDEKPFAQKISIHKCTDSDWS